jgi:multidrug efflux pump subunit AcrB
LNQALGVLFRGFNRVFDWTTTGYGHLVSWCLRLCVIVLMVYVGLLGLTYFGFTHVPTGFIPQQDKGYLVVNIQLPEPPQTNITLPLTPRSTTS